jgi:glutamyl-tRNA reductase
MRCSWRWPGTAACRLPCCGRWCGLRGEAAARHLLRVASGLESFVLGETEIAGQVRAAASISQSVSRGDAVLGKLMDAAIRASRKRHRETSLTAATGRSPAWPWTR